MWKDWISFWTWNELFYRLWSIYWDVEKKEGRVPLKSLFNFYLNFKRHPGKLLSHHGANLSIMNKQIVVWCELDLEWTLLLAYKCKSRFSGSCQWKFMHVAHCLHEKVICFCNLMVDVPWFTFNRNFAKRQMTWFRNEHIYHWLDASQPLVSFLMLCCNWKHHNWGNRWAEDQWAQCAIWTDTLPLYSLWNAELQKNNDGISISITSCTAPV